MLGRCLQLKASIDVIKMIVEDARFDMNVSLCGTHCEFCGECNYMRAYVLFCRQTKGIPLLLLRNGFKPTNMIPATLKVVRTDLQTFLCEDKILLMKLHQNQNKFKPPGVRILPLGISREIAEYL